jgi:hypothetical protein
MLSPSKHEITQSGVAFFPCPFPVPFYIGKPPHGFISSFDKLRMRASYIKTNPHAEPVEA